MHIPPIEGASKVIDAFGYFPTFHDGEIIELRLIRNTSPDESYPTVSITFTLHGWEMTSELTAIGHFVLTKRHLIKFRFDHIDAVNLLHFNHQNVISELVITGIDPPSGPARIKVEFGSCYGLEGGFTAVFGEVEGIVPCDENACPIPVEGGQS